MTIAKPLARHFAGGVAAVILGLIVLAVSIGPLLSPHAVDAIDFAADWGAAPTLDARHWFGTDSLGRDLFVRTLEGGRTSLLVGLVATMVSVIIGVAWGALAGYFGGRIDQWMMRGVDVLYALPFLFIVILLMVAFGRELWLVFAAIGAVTWLDMARVVRGQTLALRQRGFVIAAGLAGVTDVRIILRHILPNLSAPVIAVATLTVPQAILIESFLSFLGLGVQEPHASWGMLINDGARDMEITPWALAFPAGFLVTTLLCLNVLGERLRQRDGDR
ncbi:ABC transporter permease [Sinimarinibacterium flocculans]|uniref:Oligopeptide transport system permease protein n=1 Tax=Sinimarinibacterium flocculans TaxID=985250 RepID=A0A318EAM9_9GAMM|nr:ABC transporter permease subunit [Sinimarinibacterium flocculans]PXV69637.1 oligopeptide transport system permease protein [Sinimarinibacterium flocculans]